MAFDADTAGQEAAKRGIDVALAEGLNVKVIRLPADAGKDADECLKKNPAIWFKAVDEAEEVMAWHFKTILGRINLKEPKQKQQASAQLLAEIVKIPYAVEQGEWLKKISEQLGIEPDILREELKRIKKVATSQAKTGQMAENKPLVAAPPGRLDLLWNSWWAICLKWPAVFDWYHQDLNSDLLAETQYLDLYELSQKSYNEKGKLVPDFLRNQLSEIEQNKLDLLMLLADKDYGELTDEAIKQEAGVILSEIKKERNKTLRNRLMQELTLAQSGGDKAKAEEIFKQIASLK